MVKSALKQADGAVARKKTVTVEGKVAKKVKAAAPAAAAAASGKKRKTDKTKGVIYVGHIPHGYYEEQMRHFLSQYGKIRRLRLSRSPKTGASKGYAFVQFDDPEVGPAVAEELNGTFITGKVLHVAEVAPEKVHSSLWRGMKMKKLQKLDEDIRINGRVTHYQGLSKHPWQQKLMNYITTERNVNEKLQKAGIDYEFHGFETQLEPLGLDYVPRATARDSAAKGIVAGKAAEAAKKQKAGKLDTVEKAKPAAAQPKKVVKKTKAKKN
eukprot:TRINITY_DN50254_c0_g1_i1.p1 TRINITY_DN50254_c0_g1~~TRINITY_DN50254_c0_g1_i1.p1  ORF type:complete len:268 (+),score=123.40 TRINITY_DN50254_c0_g1_i1:112-915(+)